MAHHWPGHERIETTENPKRKGKQKDRRLQQALWQWPHLDYASVGRATLVSENGGGVRWSTALDTSRGLRFFPLGNSTKVFPETRPPQVNSHEPSARRRAEKGLQYLRAYFPDADFPGEFLGNVLEADIREMRRLKAFDPLLGNLLEIIPSHHSQDDYVIAFPMGELGKELNISRFSSDRSGNMVVKPSGSPSFVFETPVLQISGPSTVGPSQWVSTRSSVLLVRTHTSSSLLRLEANKVTRELDITRSETGGIPIMDSRILASGPDIVAVNRTGKVYKCNTYHGGKAMQLIGAHEVTGDDYFWQLGTTGRSDECFLASCKAVKHIDFRSANSAADVFSLEHSSTIVTSFESPVDDHISRITTTSDVIWLDGRFRKRPLLSFKHYRSFDRTLRVLTTNLDSASFSLLTSRRNGLVTLYDVSRGADNLLHCNSNPSCLPHTGPVVTAYDGNALVVFPSDMKLTLLRLCQRGSIYRQDVRVTQPDEDQPGSVQEGHVTHQWSEDILKLERQASELYIDFGPAGGRHFTEVNFRGAYEKLFTLADDTQEVTDERTLKSTLDRLPDIWQCIEETAENMLTTFDVISGIKDGDNHLSHTSFLAGSNINSKQVFDALMCDSSAMQKLADLAQWHYDIQDTSIPVVNHNLDDCVALHEYLKELDLVSGTKRDELSVQRETEAREQLVVDLALSKDVYSARPFEKPHSPAASERTPNTIARPMEIPHGKEPPDIKLGYFRPVCKAGTDHYAGKEYDEGRDPGISSPLGVRLLLAEWELGTDPSDYTYRDPYGVANMDVQSIPQHRKLPAAVSTSEAKQIPLQQPPLILAAAAHSPVTHPVERYTTSQRLEHVFDAFSQSQEAMMSTQVLPGPFGGRLGRKAKKRVGGF